MSDGNILGLSQKASRGFVFFLLLGFTLSFSGCVGSSQTRRDGRHTDKKGPQVTAASGMVAREGRFRETEQGELRFAWAGSALTVRFKGTALSVELTDKGDNFFFVLVDGKPLRKKLNPGAIHQTIELVSGLSRAEHVVTLYKLTEPLVGETIVHGFEVEPYGEFLPPVAQKKESLLLIGDSISTGYGNEGKNEKCHFTPGTENHFFTYGARIGRELGVGVTTAAWSGRGVFSNRGSTTETTTMSSLWATTLPAGEVNQDLKPEELKGDAPTAVVVNLGTNDFAPGVTDTKPFAPAYQALVNELRVAYPEAAIFLVVGPLLSDQYPEGKSALSSVRKTLKDIALGAQTAGDKKVFFFELSHVKEKDGFGCDFHPSIKSHMLMAGELLGALRESQVFEKKIQ